MTTRTTFDPGLTFDLPGDVVTHSRAYAWWLKHIRGYHLRLLSRFPHKGLFGQIVYRDKYVLNRQVNAH